jgi:hypothetical protein
MYLNHIKNNFKATLTMDSVLTNIMGFHHLHVNDVQKYLETRISLDKKIKIGVLNFSSEVLPIPDSES